MSVLSNVKIGIKLFGGFLLISLVFSAVSAVNAVRLAQIRDMQQKMYRLNIMPLKDVVDLTEAFQKTRVCLRDVLLAATPEALEQAESQLKDSNKVMEEAIDSIDTSSKAAKGAVKEVRQSLARYHSFQEQFLEIALAGKKDEAIAYGKSPEVVQIIKGCAEQVKGLAATKIANADKRAESIINITNSSLTLSVICVVVVLLMSVGFGLIITRSITRPIQELAQLAEHVAGGDLSVRIVANGQDEIGALADSFARMAESLRETLCKLDDTSMQVAAASNQLHSSSRQISTGTDEMAQQALTVATASEELAATSGDIAQNCHAAARSSQQANSAAETGAAVVAQTITVMNRIAERTNSTARTVENLGARSDQIGDIVGTIEDIADQTNLLALNAAIEAARAGEQGRGFAVVADEVRALAARTTRATREIGDMIKAIQSETKGAIAAMEDGVSEVRQGTEEAAKSGSALQDILYQINAVTMQVNQIATAANEQSATTSEITNNIHLITDVVQQTAQSSQESTAAAAQLARLSDDLRSLVNRFRFA
jgi:methyl-accepting chemotaxis protein